jgi:membrane protein YdbS with pleckstrin-like domain
MRARRDPGRRYLLATERRVVVVRKHPAVLLGALAKVFGLLLLGGYLYASTVVSLTQSVVVAAMIAAHLWLLWKLARWYVDRFIVTDRRIMLVSGIVARKVAMMPMAKLTDMSYERSTIGVLLGYGTFVLESAGQDQALSRIDYVPRPDQLFAEISELLFGRSDEPMPGPLGPLGPPGPPNPPGPPALPPTPAPAPPAPIEPHGSFS